MKYLPLCFFFLFVTTSANGQFKSTEKGLTIIVSDGTDDGRNSKIQPGDDIPKSYEYTGSKATSANGQLVFKDPIRELGMTDCIQAAAFLERPKFGKTGFMLIFSINDSIGGKQATLFKDGKSYLGVYRLIRQKLSSDEIVPKGMTTYEVKGTFLLLGIS